MRPGHRHPASTNPSRLKKAYRKKALELHPDRNYGDVERTTELFAEVRSAYEVLSDDQERSWYDAHEGDILRGGTGEGTTEDHYQGNMRVTTAEDLVRIMGSFRGNVQFSDSPHGFFGFVKATFEQLAREEDYAADHEDIAIPEYPTFGHKDDQYDDVVRTFYLAWTGFATAKSFAWLDRYRLADAPDRRTRRLMEKENQKFRDDGRREFNDAVRALVAFVRKRDPRYVPNTQSDEVKAKAQRDARQAQAARARAAQLAKLEQEAQAVPNWATARPADESDEESDEELEEEHYECVACNKTFKSERQYEAHEKSKKHQKAIQSLKRKMQRDNAHLHLDDDVLDSGIVTPASDHLGAETASSDMSDGQDPVQDHIENSRDASHESIMQTVVGEELLTQEDADSGPRANGSDGSGSDDADDGGNDEYATRSDIEARLASFSIHHESPETTVHISDTRGPKPPQEPKLGKAALKRAKKAAKQATEDQPDSKHQCQGCDSSFTSKNQLFQHLNDHLDHAAPRSGGGKKAKKR